MPCKTNYRNDLYYGLVLFASMFLVLVGTREGRLSFRCGGLYGAGLVFLALSLPNLIWLSDNNLVALNYAFGRASLSGESGPWWNHFFYPWRAVERTFSVIVVPLAFFFAIFFERDRNRSAYSGFDHAFVRILCWGPFLFTLTFSLLTGGKINYSWCVPCFSLLTLFLFMEYRPVMNVRTMRLTLLTAVIILTVFGLIFTIRSLYHQGYRKRGCDFENYPGRAIAAAVTSEWREKFGTPLPYVVAKRTEACQVALHSPDRPQPYFNANPDFSQWIDEKELREKGGVIVWEDEIKDVPGFVDELKKRGFRLTPPISRRYERDVPRWFQALIRKSPRQDWGAHCFIIPEKTKRNP